MQPLTPYQWVDEVGRLRTVNLEDKEEAATLARRKGREADLRRALLALEAAGELRDVSLAMKVFGYIPV